MDSTQIAELMRTRLVEMGGSVGWNSLTDLWHAHGRCPSTRGHGTEAAFFGDGATPEEAVASAYAEWCAAGRPDHRPASEPERQAITEWCEQEERDRQLGADVRRRAGEHG